MADPAIAADPEEMRKLGKSHADLLPIVTAYRQYRQLESDLETAKELLQEEDLAPEDAEMLEQEINNLQGQMKEGRSRIEGGTSAQGSE